MGTTFAAQLQGSFFHYSGSMTAPPCSETVHWYIMQASAPVTKAMINNFKSLFPEPANARPVQKMGDRMIIDSEVELDDAEFDVDQFDDETHSTRRKHWSYKDTNKWEEEFPDCGGARQSPIDINTQKAGDVTGTGAMLSELVRYSQVGPFAFLKTVNNGHAVQVKGDFGVLMLPDGDYEAKQLHFHFPSEHTLDGENAAGEMHIVHQRIDAEGTEGLAVISILLQVGVSAGQPELSFFDSIGFGKDALPSSGDSLELPANLQVDLGTAFAQQLAHPYYHYRGSLTTPPCSETVHWYVLETPATVTQGMVDEFKSLFPDPMNNRPVQKLNGRKVGVSEMETGPEEYENEEVEHEWGYGNTERWAKSYPNCAGTEQSPINIDTATTAPAGASGAQLSQFTAYETLGPYAWLKVFNNGHSVQLNGAFGSLSLPDGEYEAKQLHFHFPSEHEIDGVLAAGEMQIVHQRKGATGPEGLAVMSVMLHDSDDVDAKTLNFLNSLGFSGRLPTEGTELELPVGLTLNLGEIFHQQLAGDFYHYEGSLTTPPCSETVHWYVLQTPSAVGRSMVNNFKSLFPPPANNRPVQPLNGRAVVISDLATNANEFGSAEPVETEIEEPDSGSTEETSKRHKEKPWSYRHPGDWEEHYGECGGDMQSPIDIDTVAAVKEKRDSPPLSDLVQYNLVEASSGLKIKNSGHAVELDGNFGVLKLPDGEYEVKQLQFHFPSEHSVDGVLAIGEMHIVHQLKGATGTDGLAVIAVLLHEAGLLAKSDSVEQGLSFFEALGFGKQLPIEDWELSLPGDYMVDLDTTFETQLSGPFFHYQGSLTAPPCSETVHWYVLERPAAVTQAMVNNFKALFPDPMNNRPIQATNGRTVVIDGIQTDRKEFGNVLPVEGDGGNMEWTYDAPEAWEDAYPDCGGESQSPVDIDTVKADDFRGKQSLSDRVQYSPLGPNSGLQVLNNGHVLKVDGPFGNLELPDGTYAVRQIHFHFPSEHSIDGVLAAGEMNIIHQRVGAEGTDGIAIVSVLLHDAELLQSDGVGKELGFFSNLGFGAVLPQTDQKMDVPADTVIDLGSTFSSQLDGNFYHYSGSLTRPPCTEGVRWYILETPAPISKSMINNFKALFPSPMNNRPAQLINDREVWINSIKTDKCEFSQCEPDVSVHKSTNEKVKRGTKGKTTVVKSDASTVDHSEPHPVWNYASVQHWENDYAECGGKKQSPVDINTGKIDTVEGPGSALNVRMTYGAVGPNAGFQFKNNGHSLSLEGNWGSLRLPDGDYIAKQIHFHFPSEHAVDGVLAAGEMHIIHQRSNANGTDGLAVIGVLLRDSDILGQAGPVGFFDRLGFSSKLPAAGEVLPLAAETVLDIGAIFAPQLAGAYWHYEGSLTSPPCSETVHWYLMQTPVGISKSMVNSFKSLFPAPANNRPVQDLYNRPIVDTEVSVSREEFQSY